MKIQNSITITAIIFVVIMSFAMTILWNKFLKSNKRLKDSMAKIESNFNGIHEDMKADMKAGVSMIYRVDSLMRYDEFFGELVDKIVPDDMVLMERYCNLQIEENIRELEVAKAYDCLAKVNLAKNSPASEYRAIRAGSASLETSYYPAYAQNLANVIIRGFEEEANAIFVKAKYTGGVNNFITGNTKDELLLLEELAKSDQKELKLRALYRMSMIYNFGRSSNLEGHNFDLKLSAQLQREVLEKSGIKPSKETNIAFVFNDKYAPYSLTTMASVLLNSDLDNHYNVYVVMDDTDPVFEESKNKLRALQSIRPFNLEFKIFPKEVIEINKEIFKHARERLPQLVFFKAMMQEVLKDVPSLVVLDVDILVLRDLHRLQEQENFDKYFLAGTLDTLTLIEPSQLRKECGGMKAMSYINSGIMVMNLDNMREENAAKLMLERFNLGLCPVPLWADQDVINNTFSDRIKFISSRWNMSIEHNDSSYYKNFMPFIVHFMGSTKPWGKEFKAAVAVNKPMPHYITLWWEYSNLVDSIVK
jgi:UDP-glucose:(galactosyl)LPS alpha-1,2-glucosyltransferase